MFRKKFAAAAVAVFAWVLWEVAGSSPDGQWRVVDGFESLQECRQARGRYAEERGYTETSLPYAFLGPNGNYYQLSCLPGTVGSPRQEMTPGR